jgi:hypothetical protein
MYVDIPEGVTRFGFNQIEITHLVFPTVKCAIELFSSTRRKLGFHYIKKSATYEFLATDSDENCGYNETT